jgi:tRNA pseudouridine synthase 10
MDESCCSVCFGILLPTCHQDDSVASVDNISRVDIVTSMVSQAVQRESYQIDEFCLEISLPAVVAANERAIRYHIYLKITASVFCVATFNSYM